MAGWGLGKYGEQKYGAGFYGWTPPDTRQPESRASIASLPTRNAATQLATLVGVSGWGLGLYGSAQYGAGVYRPLSAPTLGSKAVSNSISTRVQGN